MSYNPHAFAEKLPTGVVSPPLQQQVSKFACLIVILAPVLYAVVVPALQAYSHSASVGKR
jgi:hypothetical protein